MARIPRSDERPVPALLNGGIQRYLHVYRPILQKGVSSSRALWLSSQDGSAMKYSYVTELVTETTRLTLGVKVSPHLFRMSAASTAATYAGTTPHLASGAVVFLRPTRLKLGLMSRCATTLFPQVRASS
jgi:hypothetical protein